MTNRKIVNIAEKVRFLRQYDGMSIKEMAGELKLHKDRIAQLETGAYRADLQDVIRYCDFFGLDYEGFLFDDLVAFKNVYIADNEKMLKTIGYKI